MGVRLPSDLVGVLANFMPAGQLAVVLDGTRGEEGAHFLEKLAELGQRVRTMPRIYEQEGLGQDAVAYLHYFRGGNDWYITERDLSAEQKQAFGVASLLGHDPEPGYIGVDGLIRYGVELDLYFNPTPLRQLPAA